jgi:trk system potassium uptake protein TrkH
MNYGVIRNIIGKIAYLLAGLLVLPLIVSLIYKEGINNYMAFILPIVFLALLGLLCTIKKSKNMQMRPRDGIVIVSLTWIMMALFGCIPLILTGDIPNFFDAFFEMASGFTTTGASILDDSTILSRSIMFWRSFSHYVGGMGVLVLILAIIPESKEGSAMHILKAESPGPQVGKLVSKMQVTSRILYLIYFVITVVEFLLLWLGPDKKMDFFYSLIYTFGTAGTGGFTVHQFGIELFSSYTQYVIAIFMIIFGINFSLFYYVLIKNFKDIFTNTEIKLYFVIVITSIILICINIYPIYQNAEQTFRLAFFQVASLMSTTGYSTANFDQWPSLSKTILVFLIFIGGCAGSTAGGFKVSRVGILFKAMVRKVKNMIHPRKVESVYIDGKPLDDQTVDSVQGYMFVYFLVFIICALLISFDGASIETNFTASLTCLSNVGPGFGNVGPYSSFSFYSNFSKFILSLEMITGRLELFPILILLSPRTWMKNK